MTDVKEFSGSVQHLIGLYDQKDATYKKLFELCLLELRKSKRFIDMSDAERAHRRDLIGVLEKLTKEPT